MKPKKREMTDVDRICFTCHLIRCEPSSKRCPYKLAGGTTTSSTVVLPSTAGFKEKPIASPGELGQITKAIDKEFARRFGRKRQDFHIYGSNPK